MQVATGPAAAPAHARAARFALAALLAAAAAILPADAAVAKPTFTPEEKAAAIVRPAVVYIEVQWEGWVRDKVTGKLWDNNSVSFTARCSGFAVSNDGFIVTAGHCVDPGVEGVGVSFFDEIADRYFKAGIVTQSETQELIQDMLANAEVEGKTAGDPAVRKVFAQRGVAKSGLTSGEAMQARVVSFHPVSGGDVALIKIEKANQPMVTLADSADIKVGTDVLAIGYPASADSISDATFEPSNKDGKISNKRTEGGVPFYETSAATTQGMSGGPVSNLNGEIIGLVSHGPAAEKQAFNFLAASSIISEELSKSGVKNDLGKIDKDYRDGLNSYYEGRYTAAIEKFDQVLATVPSHAQAQEYRQQAVGLRETEGEADAFGAGVLIIGGIGLLVVLLLAGALVAVLLTRNKKRSLQPAMAGGYPMAPVTYPPISGPPTPHSGAPPSGPPYSGAPYSGAPYSGQPMPSSTPFSGPPFSAPATPPFSAPPAQSGPPYSGPPYSGPPAPALSAPSSPPFSGPPAPPPSAPSSPPFSGPPAPASPPFSAPPAPSSPPLSAPSQPSSPPLSAPPVQAPPHMPAPAPPVFSAPPSPPPISAPPMGIPVPQPPAAAVTNPMAAPAAPAAPASMQYCSNCGNGSTPGTKFCATCGQQFP